MVEENQKPEGQKGAGALQDLTGKIELIDDSIILNEEFKKNVAIPYFKDIYKDLAAQSDAKSKGINKISILNVSTSHILGQKGSIAVFCLLPASKIALAFREKNQWLRLPSKL